MHDLENSVNRLDFWLPVAELAVQRDISPELLLRSSSGKEVRSLRDAEELLAQRGIEVRREAVRCLAIKFGR